jgi:hypothetical protein
MLHGRLHDIAKTDLEAANILTQNNHYPQAIYFYQQAFEKATKSVVALYLLKHKKKTEPEVSKELSSKKTYGHKLVELTVSIAKILTEKDRNLYLSRGGKETDQLIQDLNKSIDNIRTHTQDKMDLIAYYKNNVKKIYELFYERLQKNAPVGRDNHPGWKILRERYANPKTKYSEIGVLTQFLFIVLDGMDLYTRYPMEDVNYNNIKFLSGTEIYFACVSLGEMVGE